MVDIQRKIKIFDGQTGKNPIVVRFSLPDFRKIHFAELTVNLGGTDGFFDIPLTSWKLKKILVNGFTFFPSNVRNSRNVIHNETIGNFSGGVITTQVPPTLQISDNVIQIFYEAPLGTGSLSPEVPVDATLVISGEQETDPSKKVAKTFSDITNQFSNIGAAFQTGAEKATLPTIIILALVAAAVIAVAFIVSRGHLIAQTTNEVVN